MTIKNNFEITLDKFINFALYDKKKGYYMQKNPFGLKGDFITAPNISRMFSEMIAVWILGFWKNTTYLVYPYDTSSHPALPFSVSAFFTIQQIKLQTVIRMSPYRNSANQSHSS